MTAVSSTVRLDAVRFTTLEIVSMVRPMYSEDPEPLRAPHADEAAKAMAEDGGSA
jgi:hypothetical protein